MNRPKTGTLDPSSYTAEKVPCFCPGSTEVARAETSTIVKQTFRIRTLLRCTALTKGVRNAGSMMERELKLCEQ